MFNVTSPDCSAVFNYVEPVTGATCSDFTLQDVLSVTIGSAECLSNDLFIDEMNTLVYIFIGIAVAAFLFGTLQIWLFRLATEKQVYKIRLTYYEALLQQELAWFEIHPAGTITSYLSRYLGIGMY